MTRTLLLAPAVALAVALLTALPAAALAGDPSGNYGSGGVSMVGLSGHRFDAGSELDPTQALALEDGSVIVGLSSPRSGATVAARLVKITPTGTLDGTFGVRVLAAVGTLGRIHVDPDGTIVVPGGGSGAGSGFLARLLPNGSNDPTFNGGNPAPLPSPAVSAATHPSGRYIVHISPDTRAGSLMRINLDGTGDAAFGVVTISPDKPGDVVNLAGPVLARPDGSYLVVDGQEDNQCVITPTAGCNLHNIVVRPVDSHGVPGATGTTAAIGLWPDDARVDAAGRVTVLTFPDSITRILPPYNRIDPAFGSGGCETPTRLGASAFTTEDLLVGPAGGYPAPGLLQITPDGRPDLTFGVLGEAHANGPALDSEVATGNRTARFVVGVLTDANGGQQLVATRFDGGIPRAPTGTRPAPLSIMTFSAAGDVIPSFADNGGHYAQSRATACHDLTGVRLNRPVVGGATAPTAVGYWLVASDGGIFAFGDARFYGSTGAIRLNQPIVGMTATPSGRGYWLVASDGGTFAFGDARFYGSTGAIRLNRPIVAVMATPSGRGYYLAASDGGIFTFGDAVLQGAQSLTGSPVVGITGTLAAAGYELHRADCEHCAPAGPFSPLECSPTPRPLHGPLVGAASS